MSRVFKFINNHAAAILILLALVLIVLSIKNVMALAHFHIDQLCADGMELVTDSTDEVAVYSFEITCERVVVKGKEIFSSVINTSLLSSLVALFLIFISIFIRKRIENS